MKRLSSRSWPLGPTPKSRPSKRPTRRVSTGDLWPSAAGSPWGRARPPRFLTSPSSPAPPPHFRPQGCDKPLGCAEPCAWGRVLQRESQEDKGLEVGEGFDWELGREHPGPWRREGGFTGVWPVHAHRAPCSEGPVSVCMLYYHHLAILHNFCCNSVVLSFPSKIYIFPQIP